VGSCDVQQVVRCRVLLPYNLIKTCVCMCVALPLCWCQRDTRQGCGTSRSEVTT